MSNQRPLPLARKNDVYGVEVGWAKSPAPEELMRLASSDFAHAVEPRGRTAWATRPRGECARPGRAGALPTAAAYRPWRPVSLLCMCTIRAIPNSGVARLRIGIKTNPAMNNPAVKTVA